MWDTLLVNPILNLLVALYRGVGNLGIAIILFTVIVKFVMVPLTIPSLKMAKKQRDIQPELDKIKKKFSYDKKKLAEEQMLLFKKHGLNPGAGCITTIITLVFMIAVYNVISMFTMAKDVQIINARLYFSAFKFGAQEVINTSFLHLNLTKPDPFIIVTILAVVTQFLATKMMMPYSQVADKAVKKTPGQADDIAQAMQKQNLYIMPIMFFVFGLTLPSGVMLYILFSTIFQIVQTYMYSGWGGLKPWLIKLKFVKRE
jgi:YidC/Oxa1 family membrane protein insertase